MVAKVQGSIDRERLARAIHEYNAANGIDCMHENDESWSWDCVSEAEDKADIYERLSPTPRAVVKA